MSPRSTAAARKTASRPVLKPSHKRRGPSDGPAISQHGEQLTDLTTEEQRIALARRAAAAQGLTDLTAAELEFLKPPPPSLKQEMTDEEAHQRAIGAFRIIAPSSPPVPDMLADMKTPARTVRRGDRRIAEVVAHLDRERKDLERRLRSGKAVTDPTEIERLLARGV